MHWPPAFMMPADGAAGDRAHAPVPLSIAARPTALSVRDAVDRYSLMASLAMELDRLLGETLSREVRFIDDDIDCTCGTRKPKRRKRRHGHIERSLATQSCVAAQLHCTSCSA